MESQHQHSDTLVIKLEPFRQSLFNPGSYRVSAFVRFQDDVATGNIGRNSGKSQLFQTLLQSYHWHFILSADVDATQKYYVGPIIFLHAHASSLSLLLCCHSLFAGQAVQGEGAASRHRCVRRNICLGMDPSA